MKPLNIVFAVGAILAVSTAGSADAQGLLHNAKTVFDQTGSPIAAGSVVTATFSKASPGAVDMTVAFNQGSGSGYTVSDSGNLADRVTGTCNSTLTFVEAAKSPSLTPGVKSAGLTTGTASQTNIVYSYLAGLGALSVLLLRRKNKLAIPHYRLKTIFPFVSAKLNNR